MSRYFPKCNVPPDTERCQATVLIRDTLRYTGRGKRGNCGFEMHYNERRCTRRAEKSGYCWQHGVFGVRM